MTPEEQKKNWEERTLEPILKKFPERKEEFHTSSDIPLPRLLTPQELDYAAKLGFPGEYPFTRGVQPSMYRGRFWTMRQYAGYATAEESNRRYRYLLEQGQTGLSVAFDLPTQIGYDANDPIALGEVGKVGVSISSLEDMAVLFDQIPLGKVSTSMTINAPASILLAMYIVVAKRQGVEPRQLRGTVQNDILKEYIARGTYIFPPAPSMRLITDVFRYCQREAPRWNTISISGYHIREAGSTAVQEAAFTLANGIAYVQAAIDAGLDVDSFASQLSFFFNAHNNFLEEVAKFRAARRMWARIMRERFNAQDPRSWMLRFHTQTAGSTLTAQQPENNVVRVALQALAAVMGGTQSLHTNSMDEALWLPTERAVRVALRTQQIIAHESGVADSIDPLAGSYVLEYLTDEIEQRAEEYIRKIDDLGGALAAIENGFIQGEIQSAAYDFQRAVERGDEIVVGVNAFQVDESLELERLKVDPAIEEGQRQRLSDLRRGRDATRVSELLGWLENAARGQDNLMPVFIECVENHITLGEICGLLRRLWGEYRPPSLDLSWEENMAVVKRIDHVAILVDDLEKTLTFWQDGLGMQMTHLEDVPAEKSIVAFLPVGGSELELVKPTTGDSGLSRYLEKRGPGMHHICLEVDDIEGMLDRLREQGVQLINETPVTGAGGKRYAFVHPKSANGVMVELYELPR